MGRRGERPVKQDEKRSEERYNQPSVSASVRCIFRGAPRRTRAGPRHAQASLEFMLVLGFMFAILVPLLALYARTQAETTNAFADAQTIRLGNTLRDVAERVYFAGSPAQETLTVTVPRGIARAQIEEYDQVYTLGPPSEEYTIRITGLAPLNGTLPARAGTYRVVVTATNGTAYVRIP